MPGSARALTQPRRVALLVYLVLARPRGLHARDRLVDLLWPEADQSQGRQALRNALHGIRTTLGDGIIITAGDGLVGIADIPMDCDVLDLEGEFAAGNFADDLERLDGELLDGFHVSGAGEFQHWLDAERLRLRGLMRAAWQREAEAARARGDRTRAVGAARRALAVEPGDEMLVRLLVSLLHESGDRAAALKAYEEFAQWCREEFGTEPSTDTLALVARVRASPATPDPRAYVAYVRGTYLFLRSAHRGDPADMAASAALFRDAIRFDPAFAPAYAGLSNYYAAGAARNLLKPFRANFDEAIAWCHRALALDRTLAIPHVHFGVQAMYLDDDWPRAGAEFAEAIALEPDYAEARRFLGIHHLAMRRDEDAIRELREAARLEPRITMYHNSLGDAYLVMRRYDEAVSALRRALELDPHYAPARERLLRAFEQAGRFEEALAERALDARSGTTAAFARALAEEGPAGYRRERERELREMIAAEERRLLTPQENAGDEFVPPHLRLAVGYADLGEWDRAAACEDAACRNRPGRRRWFIARPELAPLATRRGTSAR